MQLHPAILIDGIHTKGLIPLLPSVWLPQFSLKDVRSLLGRTSGEMETTTRSHKTVVSGEVIVRSGLTLYWNRMNETYIDNLDAIAVEQTMNGIRLSIGHEAYIMPLAIARTMCIAIQVKCFQVHQLEVEATMTRQLKTLK